MANASLLEAEVTAEISGGEESVGSVKKTSKRTPRASQSDLDALRADMNSKFDSIMSRLDAGSARHIPNSTQSQAGATRPFLPLDSTEAGNARPDTVVRIPYSSLPDDPLGLHRHTRTVDVDTISLTPGQRERRDLLGDERDSTSSFVQEARHEGHDSDVESEIGDRYKKYFGKSATCLRDAFGKDATTKTEKSTVGIALDISQTEVLKDSWRMDNPKKLSAYRESYRSLFPVSDDAEDFLDVPSIDSFVAGILTKKYGGKASEKVHLISQPMKDLEKLAYKGQQAARMGIVINLYMQQALGNLLHSLTQKDVNIDSAIQCVRDIFSMNTKSLDQMGRTGAYHHMVRRQTAMADSSLSESKDCKDQILYLPLSHEGLFGSALEQKLKERAEMNKQLAELLPDMKGKRKSGTSSEQPMKRPRFQDDRNSGYPSKSFNPNYPRLPPKTTFGPHYPQHTGSMQAPRFSKGSSSRTSTVSKSFRGRSMQK